MTNPYVHMARTQQAARAISTAEHAINSRELWLPAGTVADEVSLLFSNPDELDDYVQWARENMDHFASVNQDTALCTQAAWWEVAPPEGLENFNVRFEFLRVMGAPWRIEAMCVLGGLAPLHEEWLGQFGSGCVVHVSYKLPEERAYDAHLARGGPQVSLRTAQPTLRAEYRNSYGRFAYYQHDAFRSGDDQWFLKPRVNLRDAG